MKSTCTFPECGEPIVSTASGDVWYHQPENPGGILLIDGRGHHATPGEVEHTCTRPDPLCPLCTDDAREWLADQLAKTRWLPMPGTITADEIERFLADRG